MDDNKSSYKDRRYDIIPYDISWPEQFENYKTILRSIYGDVQIEHIGSTSVPGMTGKPCIDVLVILDDLRIVENHIHDMEQAGFEYTSKTVKDNSILFRVAKDNAVLANIHFFPTGHPHNNEMLAVRNYLRSHPEEVAAYSHLKNDLYTTYQNDYASYRIHKDVYMKGLNARATEA